MTMGRTGCGEERIGRSVLRGPGVSASTTANYWRSDDVHITKYESLARVRAVGGGVLHDDYRSDDRQRLAADDRSRSALQRDHPAVGGDGVRAHVRRLSAAGRAGRGSAR